MNVNYEHSQLHKQCVSMLAFTDTTKPKNRKWYHYSLKNQSTEMILVWWGIVEWHLHPLMHLITNPSECCTGTEDWLLKNKFCLRCQSMGLQESCLSSLGQETGTYIPLPRRFFPQLASWSHSVSREGSTKGKLMSRSKTEMADLLTQSKPGISVFKS